MRKFIYFIIVMIAHAIVSVSSMIYAFSHSMERWDKGGSPSSLEQVLSVIKDILFFPIVDMFHLAPKGMFSGLLGYIPILLNSGLWALVLTFGFIKIRTFLSNTTNKLD